MSAAPLIVSAQRCHYCSRFVHPKEIVRIGESAAMCHQCFQRHEEQVAKFQPPDFCKGCGKKTEELAAAEPDGKFRMFAHWRDGEYQLLCRACDQVYVALRKDLFGPTRFGYEERKL